MRYRCIIDGGHFVATLPGTFATEEEANDAGREWAIENNLEETEDGLLDESGELTDCGWEVEEVEEEESARNHECATCGNEVEICTEAYCNACRVEQDTRADLAFDTAREDRLR